ncbi:MAG: hypothetical protein V2B19_16950 [Pseudomonadota bacterium]
MAQTTRCIFFVKRFFRSLGYQSYTNIDAHRRGEDIKAEVDLGGHFSLGGAIACQRGSFLLKF